MCIIHKSIDMHPDKNTEQSVKNRSYMRYRERSNPISSHEIDENKIVAQQPLRNTPDVLSVYVCALSKSQPAWRDAASTPVMRLLVKSVYTTTHTHTATYKVTLLLGVDNNDNFWQQNREVVRTSAQKLYGLDLQIVSYPSQSQGGFLPFNALMRDAFKFNADYLVRVNDDTEFKTMGWIPTGIAQLLAFKPPNVGVVGPTCHQGNTRILTHDMVHRTHLHIFDNYYPVVFHNWFVDDWISTVYGPARTSKLHSWVVHHHVELGTRYTPSSRDSTHLQPAVSAGALAIEAYLKRAPQEGPLWAGARSITATVNTSLHDRHLKDRSNAGEKSAASWVVLVTVSAGFDDMFRNWLRWYSRLHLDSKVVVFAEDKYTYDKYSGVEGLDVWHPVNDTGPTSALDYNTLLYKQIVSRRSSHLLRLFEAYSHIIYTDIDTVWLQDPRPYFAGDYDLWAQMDAPHYICTGFMALRKSNDILKLLMLWNNALMQKNQLNQPVFNSLLHESSVKYLELSTVQFPSGQVLWQNIAAKIPQAVVVHNNFIIGKQSKISRFQQSKLWKPLPSDLSPVSPAQPVGRGILRMTARTGEPPAGTQMSRGQIQQILAVLPENGSLLVWGLGNDSPFWHNTTTGRVVFIEDDVVQAKTLWYDIITRKFPFLEAYKVHYTTQTVASFDQYIASPSLWKSDLDVRSQLPSELTRVLWDVIIVDAPLGCCDEGPGRYQSIYTSKLLARNNTHIFVDDFERKVENAFAQTVFGSKPLKITKRIVNGVYTRQEQAHFVVGQDTPAERSAAQKHQNEGGFSSEKLAGQG